MAVLLNEAADMMIDVLARVEEFRAELNASPMSDRPSLRIVDRTPPKPFGSGGHATSLLPRVAAKPARVVLLSLVCST
jgi:hypothetical protein